MNKRKILVLLPDGIGLRNFAYSKFYDLGKKEDFDIVYWNNTLFPLSNLGFEEIRITDANIHPFTDILKNARKQIELNLNIKKAKDYVYDSYRFPNSYRTFKSSLRNLATHFITIFFSSKKGLNKVRKLILTNERKTNYYQNCLITLQEEKPTMIFCTNQRISSAIAPLLAAQDLKIPTATFIFSWDNLPKGTMVIETDYYFVWSDQMKKELLYYYPYINEKQIIITGTPQFENHFDKDSIESKESFFKNNNLDFNKKYLCFSGDDITTSPDDPAYLKDFVEAITLLNNKGNNLGIIFRRCPVDISDRYDVILAKYKDVVVEIAPKWENINNSWNSILPTKDDLILLSNTVAHSELVVNLGSSMVFDYASHCKPCAYFNYNQKKRSNINWDLHQCYKYVHFRSMPTDAVVWLNSPDEIAAKIELMLSDKSQKVVANAEEWFKKINQHPAEDASQRIWDGIAEICRK
ncbi:UDP-glycosyltransferase [Flavobacterium sp. LB2P44]|uniref:UDP-glycosyltransferase n=1 Tax=Flavobacterium sp. LB2P44 TaxID=3401713 RepID=UPI003AB0D0FC